jgi:hypothetical protein
MWHQIAGAVVLTLSLAGWSAANAAPSEAIVVETIGPVGGHPPAASAMNRHGHGHFGKPSSSLSGHRYATAKGSGSFSRSRMSFAPCGIAASGPSSGLPPGLQMQLNSTGHLPPGLEMQAERGHFPAGLQKRLQEKRLQGPQMANCVGSIPSNGNQFRSGNNHGRQERRRYARGFPASADHIQHRHIVP